MPETLHPSHRSVVVPVPNGARVERVHWHLTPASFARIVAEHGLAARTIHQESQDSFEVADLKLHGFAIIVYSNAEQDAVNVAVNVEVSDR